MFVQVKPSAQLIGRNMLEIKKAEVDDLNAIYDIHLDCIKMLKDSDKIGARTYLDYRNKEEVSEVLSEGHSIIVMLNKKVVGYFLYSQDSVSSLTSKGLVITDGGKGLGLQRLVHKLKAKDWQISYICSKYNDVSLKNILSLGLKFKHSVNDIDNFYG